MLGCAQPDHHNPSRLQLSLLITGLLLGCLCLSQSRGDMALSHHGGPVSQLWRGHRSLGHISRPHKTQDQIPFQIWGAPQTELSAAQIISPQAPTAGVVCVVCAALPQAAQHRSHCLHPAQAALFPCPQMAFSLPGGAGSSHGNMSEVLLLQCPPASLKHPLPPGARFLQSPERGGRWLQLLLGQDQGHPHNFQSWTLPSCPPPGAGQQARLERCVWAPAVLFACGCLVLWAVSA